MVYNLGAKHVRETRISEAHHDDTALTRPVNHEVKSVRHFPVLVCRLLRNPAFVCVAFAGAFTGLVAVSIATFLPKYIQNIYDVTASEAATYAGKLDCAN